MTRLSERDLMRFYDGELSEKDAQRLARLVAEDPHAPRLLRDMELTGEMVRTWAGTRSARADEIADRVMARIQAEPAPRAARPLRTPRKAVWARALALAAGIALVLGWGIAHQREASRASALNPNASSALERVAESALALPGDPNELDSSATIELVDFGGHQGTIFLVSATSDGNTPVVWLADDLDSDESRTESL